ncbi:protein ALWAYS EARLY 3-like isoform X2 [Andrographis paniculata]|uniref:protein ALWAYS EARLY 3-like isoform X2 n=1 Tax=Andrographis paniculata TaxID=175694 RepID=UPI0021E8CA41|nr:protein ALWAYS EARLY 3-like isoform X2 [Andrographis paniculata]
MGPTKRFKRVNKKCDREISPRKESDSAEQSPNRKRKPSEMLGPQWSNDEMTLFYNAYQKFSKDWKQVSDAVRNRSSEMVETLYFINRAYLSLPHGTASADGLIAMMTEYYSSMAGTDSDQNNNVGSGSAVKTKKHSHGSKATEGQSDSPSQTVSSYSGCLPLLARSGGMPAYPVRKRTPRLHVSSSSKNNDGGISATKEGLQLNAKASDDEVALHEISVVLTEESPRYCSQISQAPSKRADENPDFDALRMLADLSLEIILKKDEPIQFEDESDVHVDGSALQAPPINLQKGKQRCSNVRKKGHDPESCHNVSTKKMKPGKCAVVDARHIPEENAGLHKLMTMARKGQTLHVYKAEAARKKSMPKRKKSTQSSLQNLMKNSDNSSSVDLHREGSDSVQPAVQVPALDEFNNSPSADPQKEGNDSVQPAVQVPSVDEFNLTPKVWNRRKMNLKNSQLQNDLKFIDENLNDHRNLTVSSLGERAFNLMEILLRCFSNPLLRRWCICEWFYSAIDYPWFAKREFDEYLCHVRLGHVSELTKAEWGIIKSSLGKPRRFSNQFLKEEIVKLNQYRDSVRKHYGELCDGVREGLPNDLARPLSVGQRVIAIHPATREIHNGSVLTVYHSKYYVQFDCHELGAEFVMDIDCMPLNPCESMPPLFKRQTIGVDKLKNLKELNLNGQFCVDNHDGISHSSQATDLARPLKQAKVASAITDGQPRMISAENGSHHQLTHSLSSTMARMQAKEADVQALTELKFALQRKEAVVLELRHVNSEVLENQEDIDRLLKDYEPFRRQYAAVLQRLSETNEKVSSALYCLRQRNRQSENTLLTCPGLVSNPSGGLSSLDHSACQTLESESHANEIINVSRTKARAIVDAAIKALSTCPCREDTGKKNHETIDYLNYKLPSDDCNPSTISNTGVQISSETISKCVATLIMIQKCTEGQFPAREVAKILDSAGTSLRPRCAQNLPVYAEIQKCLGIIRNQIIALIPTT